MAEKCCECRLYKEDPNCILSCECHQCVKCKTTYDYVVNQQGTFKIKRIDILLENYRFDSEGYPIYEHESMGETIILIAGYHSDYDLNTYRFTTTDPTNRFLKMDQIIQQHPWVQETLNKGICDKCIKTLLTDNIIEIEHED